MVRAYIRSVLVDPPVLTQLGPDDLVAALRAAHESMVVHAPAIDRLDRVGQLDGIDGGDTGSHLAAALGAIVESLPADATLTELAAALGRSPQVVPAAAGRSGRLLGAFIGGFSELCRNADALDATRLAMAFEVGADSLTAASSDGSPGISGAMAAVAGAVATAALDATDRDAPLGSMILAAAEAGLDALERTPDQWTELAELGVVDAGAAGFLVVIDTLVAIVHGDDPERPDWEFPEDPDDLDGDDPASWGSADEGDSDADDARYEVTLRLDPPNPADGQPPLAPEALGRVLQRAWVSLGDEVQLMTGGEHLVASVCTDDIGAVIESALGVGRPSEIVVRDRRA